MCDAEETGAWARVVRGRWSVACFVAGTTAVSVLTVWRSGASVKIDDADENVAKMAPRLAAILDCVLTEDEVAEAIAKCRLALAERALAELKVAEEMARAGAGA